MSRFDDFLEETPPVGHMEKVLRAAQPELEKLKQARRTASRRRTLWSALGFGLTAATAGLLVWNRRLTREESEMGSLSAFVGLEGEELELLVDVDESSGDTMDLIDLLESLEEETDWEET